MCFAGVSEVHVRPGGLPWATGRPPGVTPACRAGRQAVWCWQHLLLRVTSKIRRSVRERESELLSITVVALWSSCRSVLAVRRKSTSVRIRPSSVTWRYCIPRRRKRRRARAALWVEIVQRCALFYLYVLLTYRDILYCCLTRGSGSTDIIHRLLCRSWRQIRKKDTNT